MPLFWCCLWPCFSTNQYGANKFCRGPQKEHFYQIKLESDKLIQKKNFKVMAFFSLSDATATKVLCRIYIFEQFWKRIPKVTLAEIGQVDKEKMSFEALREFYPFSDATCMLWHYCLEKICRGLLKGTISYTYIMESDQDFPKNGILKKIVILPLFWFCLTAMYFNQSKWF